MARDVLQRTLDADGQQIKQLGLPSTPGDATLTDNATPPEPVGPTSIPGASLLAAPADHVHGSPTPMRVAAFGLATVIPAGATVELALFRRRPGEVLGALGSVFIRDSVPGASWAGQGRDPDGGKPHDVVTFHERTSVPEEVRFMASNRSAEPRTIDWACLALQLPGAGAWAG